jgi:hypothetical protein
MNEECPYTKFPTNVRKLIHMKAIKILTVRSSALWSPYRSFARRWFRIGIFPINPALFGVLCVHHLGLV